MGLQQCHLLLLPAHVQLADSGAAWQRGQLCTELLFLAHHIATCTVNLGAATATSKGATCRSSCAASLALGLSSGFPKHLLQVGVTQICSHHRRGWL